MDYKLIDPTNRSLDVRLHNDVYGATTHIILSVNHIPVWCAVAHHRNPFTQMILQMMPVAQCNHFYCRICHSVNQMVHDREGCQGEQTHS